MKQDTYKNIEPPRENGRYDIECKHGAINRTRMIEMERRADYLEHKLDKMTYLIITSLITAVLNLVANIGAI